MHRHVTDTPPNASVAAAVSMGVLALGLTLTAADVPLAWLVWPLGYGAALPLAIGYADRRRRRETEDADPTEIEAVRRRYVEGDIDERELESELERTLDAAEAR